VSYPETPSFYEQDPRRSGRVADAPEERRDRSSRGFSSRSRTEQGGRSDLGQGRDGFSGYRGSSTGLDDRGRDRQRSSGRSGGRASGRTGVAEPPTGRKDQDGRSGRGRDAREEGRSWGRPEGPRPNGSRPNGSRGRQPAEGGAGSRGTSASRERYAAARERYAARVGAGKPGRAGRDAGARYGANGLQETDYPDTGYRGNGHRGNGYPGNGYGGNGHRGRRASRWSLAGLGFGGRNGGGGGPRDGDRPRRKGDWWRHWTLKKAAAVLVAAAGVVVMLCAIAVGVAYAKTPIPNVQAAAIQAASTVYFSNDKTQVGQFGTFDRQPLLYTQIPPVLRNAVVAAEDKNFWHEGGISPTGILRAAYYDLTSSGGNLQGGSTITQQLVRNYYQNIGTAQTASRKIKEIFVAEKLAQVTSKEQILKEYLNTVYLGDGAYGVGAAAQVYFGLSAQQLNQITPAQAAMIAAMIQQPSGYSPNPKAGAAYQGLVFRWHYVLGAMVKMGTLSQRAAAKAVFPKVVKPFTNNWSGYRGYIMNAVLYELEHTYHYSQHAIFSGGLRVVTTFNQKLMNQLYATVAQNETLMRNDEPPALPSATTVACGSAGCLPKYVHVGAVLEQPGTGAILAMYSGQNYKKTQYDNALQSRNQVGSSFKPYVLSTAVKDGMNVLTSKLNGFSPLWIPPDSQPMTFASLTQQTGSQWYEVSNDEVSNPNRPVSVVEATALSLNTAYADLWHRVAVNQATGAHSVVNMAADFGVDAQQSGLETMRDEAGTALGQASLTVEEQATMIATLADGGEYSTPHVIKDIITSRGGVIPARVEHREVLTPTQAAQVDYAMSFDTGAMGTANGLGLTNGQTVIAKTGTTNLSQSAFFLGATQRDAMAVGMFVSKPHCPASVAALCTSTQALAFAPPAGVQTLFGVGGYPGYGGQWPAIIWHDYFMNEFNSQAPEAWPAPDPNYGTAWNLVPPLPKPKPKPHNGQCNGNAFRCRQNQNGTPSPGATCQQGPVQFPCPGGTPSPPGGAATQASASSATAGGLVAGGVMVALLPARIRRWRRKRPAGQRGS
jgi:membrane peptidoglycan carboxypeptidase